MPPVHYHEGRFPPDARLDWRRLAPLIGPAAAAVARYDAVLGALPDPRSLLAVPRIQEAAHSSRIENIYASVTSVLETAAGIEPENRYALDDIRDVQNHLAAQDLLAGRAGAKPLSLGLVREVHALLLDTPRGQKKSPGEFRKEPVWIGRAGSTAETASFVGAQAPRIADAMSAWERYIHSDVRDRLVQIAVQHAEFEAVHPFMDGNGPLGRMLIPHLMWRHGLIRMPVFCLSVMMASRQGIYFDRLLGVSRNDDWTGLCLYFLDAIRTQADHGVQVLTAILDLYRSTEVRVRELSGDRDLPAALGALFSRPIFPASDFIAATGIPARSGRRLLAGLEESETVVEITPPRGRRPAVMRFPRLLKIVEGQDGLGRWPRRAAPVAGVVSPVALPASGMPSQISSR